MPLVLVTSDRFADHVPPAGHPERVERAAIMREVAERWRGEGGVVLAPRVAERGELSRVHASGYLDRLAASAGEAAVLDLDTYMSPASWDTALLAAGAVLTAVDHVLDAVPAGATAGRRGDAGLCAAFALVRPPGHHALRDRAMGFCLLNNVAVAAAHAIARGLQRVAIVDYDVHHGNGTQWCFYDDPRVLFVSLHQYPFYPQTGAAGECGVRAGEGFTVNVPMAAGAGDGDYLLIMRSVVRPILSAFAPELLILDAGFDAHGKDPIANMRVTSAGFGRIAACLRDGAMTSCGGRLVLATEGGYHLDALRESLEATLHAIARAEHERARDEDDAQPSVRGTAALELVRAAQSRYWPGL
jgi:acetoin utilization deacetylase AcuC-like enzyme